MINLNTEKISTMKIIDLDAKIFTKKTMVALVFEIDDGNIYIEIALMN